MAKRLEEPHRHHQAMSVGGRIVDHVLLQGDKEEKEMQFRHRLYLYSTGLLCTQYFTDTNF